MNGSRVCKRYLSLFEKMSDMTRPFMLLMLVLLSGAASAVTDTFVTSGTWTAPAGVTSVTVEAWGGGGAGGGAIANPGMGGGGAGGQYAKKVVTVVPGNVYAIAVGAGGVGGTGNGGAGGDSTFAGTIVVAKGGVGGTGATNGVAGVGSSVNGVGDIVYAGGSGANGVVSRGGCGAGGGGGGGAGSAGAGGNAVGNAGGAGTAVGGGAGGTATTVSGNGAAGSAAGGGGAGACAESRTDRSGGAGAVGKVTVSYVSSGTVAVTYYHDTTAGVPIGFDGVTTVTSGADQIIPPIITASMITANTCTGSARSQNHPTGLYTHSRWYLNTDYAVATQIGANPTGSARLRGGAATDTVTVSLYDYDSASGAKTLIGSSAPITLTNFANQTNYPYTISSSAYVVSPGHRLMLQYDFNQVSATFRARVYCSTTTPSYISVTEAPAPATLLAEYRFDENGAGVVANSSGGGLSGAINGGVTVGGPGKVCGSYHFNGTNAFVSVPHNALLNQGQITVMAWARHSSDVIKNWETILAKGDDAFRLHLNGGCSINAPNIGNALSFGINSGCATADADSGVIPVAGQWYHVAGTYDGATIKIYVDGVLKASGAYTGAINSNTFPLNIGENPQQPGRYWSGDLDEVKIFDGALNAADIAAGYANEKAGKNWDGTARTCPAYGPDHIEIQHDGNGLTCSEEPVIIKACADAAVPCTTLYTAGGLNVTLSPGGQAFAIDATGINSAASVQRSTVGSVTLGAVSNPVAIGATPTTCWDTVASTANCAMTFSDSGFIVTVPDHVSCNNASVTIEAVQSAPGTGRCVPTYENASRAVNLTCTYANPTTGTLPVNAAGVALNSTNDTTAACDGVGQSPTLSFDANGTATISLNYADAGQLTLTASDTAPTGKAMTGSGTFVVAPASFAFSGIPAAPLTAGQAFNATVTAKNACATPATTPNFTGQTVAITSSNPQPGLGNATAINTPLTATSGTGSANLVWDEVGTIDLNANLAAYLGSTLSISGAQTGVGRFRPAYFDTTVPLTSTTPMPCPNGVVCPVAFNGFVYSGQPFSVQVFARSLSGNTTANYAGTFAYATTLTAWDALGSTTTQNPGAGVLANNAVAAAAFVAGVATVATPTYTFATATAPTNIFMRAADTDGVTSLRAVPATSVEGGVAVASGRVKLSNAHGSELLPLPLTATVQYWNGTFWVASATDNVTSLTLAATYNVLNKAGGVTGTTTPTTTPAMTSAGVATVANGILNINLSKPTGGAGRATVTPVAPGYLPLTGALATFGVYKGNNEFIYLRENY